MQPVVTFDEVATRARELRLDLALDARIFNDVEVTPERLRNVG